MGLKFRERQRIGENLLYLMVWVVILLVPALNAFMLDGTNPEWEHVFTAWKRIAPYLLIFLIHNELIAPKLLIREHRYISYLVINILTTALVFAIAMLAGGDLFTDLPLYSNLLLGFSMNSVNAAIKLLYRSLSDEQQMEALRRRNLQAEMDYLKYQINPHFFMNTLNNIHALIEIDTSRAQSAVIDLSRMMRHILYDSGTQSIPLHREVEFIQNYIDLMRLRYDSSVDIRFDYPARLPQKPVIPPLMLVVFVENAFKHGVSYTRPSFIHIKLSYRDGMLTVSVKNSRHGCGSLAGGGIGLENVRKRLELIYERGYTLRVDESKPDVYSVLLKIPTKIPTP